MGVCLSSVKPSDSLYLFILRMESPADFVDVMAMARSQHRSDDGLSGGGGVGGHRACSMHWQETESVAYRTTLAHISTHVQFGDMRTKSLLVLAAVHVACSTQLHST